MRIVLYTLNSPETQNCPKCARIESLLKSKGIGFESCCDIETVCKVGAEQNISFAPILMVDDKFYGYKDIIKWINEYVG